MTKSDSSKTIKMLAKEVYDLQVKLRKIEELRNWCATGYGSKEWFLIRVSDVLDGTWVPPKPAKAAKKPD